MTVDKLALLLRAREAELSAIYENFPGNLFYITIEPDGDFRFASASPDFLAATGLARERILGSLVRDVIPPESCDMVLNHYREAILSGQTVRWEEESVYPAGRRYGEVAVTPLYDASGVATHLIGIVHDISERKRLEESLREGEERLRLAMSSGTIGVWDWDVSSGRVTVSPEVARIYGVDVADLRSYGDFAARVHPDDIAATESERNAAIHNHQPFDTEFRIVLPSGEIRWIGVRGQGYYDENGRVVRVVGNNVDITERKRAEEVLREREHRLRLALDGSGAGSWMRDVSTGRVDWDDRFRELYGFTSGEPASFEAWLSRVHEEDRRQQVELGDQILHTKGHDTFDSTFRIVRPDGTVLWMQSLGQAHRDAEGQLIRLTGIELDVTERRHAEEALRSAEARFREVLESTLRRTDSELRTILKAAPIGIVTMDREGNVTTWNDAAERIFGYRAEEVVGRINPAIPTDALVGFHESISRVLQGATIQTEAQEIRKDGSFIYVSLVRAPHYDENGTVKGAITLVEDITAKRTAENDLARVRFALAEARVEEAHRIARDLHDDIGQRLALLSFDIEGMAARPQISREELVMNLRSCQQTIIDIGEGLREISHRMHPSVLEYLGLSKALEHLCGDFSTRDGITVRFRSDELTNDVPRSVAACFYRVAQEALRNVSKHAKAVDIEMKLTMVGQTLQLCIEDSGIGFDTSAVKSGLGLHSMRERAELANGSFSVMSEPGSGTRIVVTIPLRELYGREEMSAGSDVRFDENIERQAKKCRVLIADDHPLFAIGVAKLLEQNYDILGTVGDGMALVDAAKQLNPDLVLLDISMPVMNGFDAARRIRRSVPGVKLLFLSTYSNPAYVDQAFKAGADGYLVKHAAVSELPTAIATVLEGRQYRSPQLGKKSHGTT